MSESAKKPGFATRGPAPIKGKRRGVSVRLLLMGSSFVIIFLLLAGTVLNYIFVFRLAQASKAVGEEMERANAALEVGRATSDLFLVLAQEASSQDAVDFAQSVRKAEQSLIEVEKRLTESAASLPVDDPVRINLDRLATRTADIHTLIDRVIVRVDAGEWWYVEQLVRIIVYRHRISVIELVEQMGNSTSERRRDAESDVDAARLMLQVVPIVVGLLVVGVVVGTAFVTHRSISKPVERLTDAATRLASGRLEERVPIERIDEFRRLAVAFNEMTDQLEASYTQLEQRVAERTRGLQAAAAVGRATTSMLDPDQLLRRVVNLARERFDLYYVGLFLLESDSGRTFAVLRAGTGEAGRQMMAQGHRLEVGGDSMIGQCTSMNEARVALDVGEEAVRFDNPLLPQTRSELALPLVARGRVIGAMTVQSVKESAFDEEYIAVLQTMADQVAVAINNAHLFAEARAALEEMAATQRRYLGQAWAEYTQTAEEIAYETMRPGDAPLGDAILPEIQQVVERRSTVALQNASHTLAPLHSALISPIALRGEIIGALGVHADKEDRQWSDDDVAIIEAVVERMALAAENIRLLEDTQRRAVRERLTSEVTARMRETLDVDTVLQTAIREIGEVLDIARIKVRMGTGKPPMPE